MHSHPKRLRAIRGFAKCLRSIDVPVEVPPSDLLPERRRRAVPYLYSDAEIAALTQTAGTLSTPHRVATFRTLIGLLAVTGMRRDEAIALDRTDFEATTGMITIRAGKFGKSRELPLHPSTATAVTSYLHRSGRPRSATPDGPALLVRDDGRRLSESTVSHTFHALTRLAGLRPRSAECRPRAHDLRHTFAVRTLLDALSLIAPHLTLSWSCPVTSNCRSSASRHNIFRIPPSFGSGQKRVYRRRIPRRDMTRSAVFTSSAVSQESQAREREVVVVRLARSGNNHRDLH